jgi:hypothetical protein
MPAVNQLSVTCSMGGFSAQAYDILSEVSMHGPILITVCRMWGILGDQKVADTDRAGRHYTRSSVLEPR